MKYLFYGKNVSFSDIDINYELNIINYQIFNHKIYRNKRNKKNFKINLFSVSIYFNPLMINFIIKSKCESFNFSKMYDDSPI